MLEIDSMHQSSHYQLLQPYEHPVHIQPVKNTTSSLMSYIRYSRINGSIE